MLNSFIDHSEYNCKKRKQVKTCSYKKWGNNLPWNVLGASSYVGYDQNTEPNIAGSFIAFNGQESCKQSEFDTEVTRLVSSFLVDFQCYIARTKLPLRTKSELKSKLKQKRIGKIWKLKTSFLNLIKIFSKRSDTSEILPPIQAPKMVPELRK